MKMMKKMMALVLAMVMVMAMSIPAMAAKITIKSNADTDEAQTETTEYSAWMLLNADIETDPTQHEDAQNGGQVSYYTTSEKAKTALETAGLFTFTQVGSESKWYATPKDGLTAAEVAAAFKDWTDAEMTAAFGTAYTGAQTEPGGSAVINAGEDGYYFIKSTLGDKIAVQTIGDVTIETKNSYPTHDKAIEKSDENAQIGDEISFTLTVNIPETANDQIVLTDVMDEGLTFKSIDDTFSSSVAYTFAPTEKTAAAVTANNNTFTLTISADVVKANQGGTLTINYIAVLNNKAEVGTPEKNTVTLDYGNNYTSVPKVVETVTHKFTFDKVDGSTKLTGAEFELQLNNEALPLVVITEGEEYRIATDEDAEKVTTIVTAGKTITINGVDSDVTYTLVETKEPAGGYNKLDSGESVTVKADDTAHYDVENNKGSVLPSTGGIGTTIFYVIGAGLVIGAGVLLVTRRRMKSE